MIDMKNMRVLLFVLISMGGILLSAKSLAFVINEYWLGLSGSVQAVSLTERFLVVRDRKFRVPRNTPIYNSDGRIRSLGSIHAGTPVTVYVNDNVGDIDFETVTVVIQVSN